jgi:hypothetical protein
LGFYFFSTIDLKTFTAGGAFVTENRLYASNIHADIEKRKNWKGKRLHIVMTLRATTDEFFFPRRPDVCNRMGAGVLLAVDIIASSSSAGVCVNDEIVRPYFILSIAGKGFLLIACTSLSV